MRRPDRAARPDRAVAEGVDRAVGFDVDGMAGIEADGARIDVDGAGIEVQTAVGADVKVLTTLKLPLRCVWTSHPHNDHCCHARIPARAVTDAWRRELALGRTCAGFFHFVWRGRVWLAYGLPDGSVRGVYCPAHRAEREERLGYDPQLALAPSIPEATAAHAS